MAACSKCGRQVGCGCHLNNEGLCATCAKEKRETIIKQQGNTPVFSPEPKHNKVYGQSTM